MYEKVSKHHPDKVADRVAGAIVDQCYTQAEGGWLKSNPRVAVEVLLGHTEGLVIIETSEPLRVQDVSDTVRRISGIEHCTVRIVPQDPHLAANQQGSPKCGDNGIAKGTPVTPEQRELTALIRSLDETFRSDPHPGEAPEEELTDEEKRIRRMAEEYDQLRSRFEEMTQFRDTEEYKQMPENKRVLYDRQCKAMDDYESALRERIRIDAEAANLKVEINDPDGE